MKASHFVNGIVAALNARMQGMLANYPTLHLLIALLGLILFVKLSLRILRVQYRVLLRRKHNLRDFGEWAVITGATDGIGKAISLQLAKKGMKVFLISRSEERLKQTAEEIKDAVPTVNAIESLCVDFSESTTEELFSRLHAALKNKDIGLLINNVGISYPCPLYYDEVDLKLLDNLVTVNVRAPLITTRAVYPGMRERRRGAIVCIGSGSSAIPSDCLYCAYSGTKGAAIHFCRSLQAECAENNIIVQCQTPLLVMSKMSKQRQRTLTIISPEAYAKSSIAAIEGAASGDETTLSPYWSHAALLFVTNAMPAWLWDTLNGTRVRSLYKRAQAKRQRQTEKEK